MKDILLTKLNTRQATLVVIGLGYVGLPLAVEFARAGLKVIGVDVDQRKVEAIGRQESYIADVPTPDLAELVTRGRLRASADYSVVAEADAVIICVPTPLNKTRDPDMSYIVDATEKVVQYCRAGTVLVLESTTYPGTTDEILVARVREKGFNIGTDLFVAFSPERIDPANPKFGVRNTPKVVGGVTPACAEVTTALYSLAVDQVVPVSSTRAAEMVKLLENTFRAVNIALINEMALMCDRLGVDVWEIIDAAATKPYGFMKFTPGPGIGGHCIPIDPLYLSWKLKTLNYSARFIELADSINSRMPEHVVMRVVDALNHQGRALKGSQLLVLGVAYKKDVDDMRESPAIEIILLLHERQAEVSYHDPHVAQARFDQISLTSTALTPAALQAADCVIVITDHQQIDWGMVAEHARLIVDTRNVLKNRPTQGQLVKL